MATHRVGCGRGDGFAYTRQALQAHAPIKAAYDARRRGDPAVPGGPIRNIDASLKLRLRVQAALHGRSMEDEARDILRSALNREPARPGHLAASIRARSSSGIEHRRVRDRRCRIGRDHGGQDRPVRHDRRGGRRPVSPGPRPRAGRVAHRERQEEDAVVAIAGLGGVSYSAECTGNARVARQTVDCFRNRGVRALVGVAAPGAEVGLNIDAMLGGRTVVGTTEGDAVPDLFIPQLARLHAAGALPLEKIVKVYDFADVNRAVWDSEGGGTVKAVLRIGQP